MDDKEILALFLARDEGALGATIRKYGRFCTVLAQNILGEAGAAEEIFNDVLLRVWNTIPPLVPDSYRAYLARLTRNAALDRFRANRAQKRYSGTNALLDELSDVLPDETQDDMTDRLALSAALDRFLGTLPREKQLLFVRRYFLGCSLSALARQSGRTPEAVSVILCRVRRTLRKFLEKEGFTL